MAENIESKRNDLTITDQEGSEKRPYTIFRILAAATNPLLLTGVCLGVVFSILAIITFTLDLGKLIVSVLIACTSLLLIAAFVGFYLGTASQKQKSRHKVNSEAIEEAVFRWYARASRFRGQPGVLPFDKEEVKRRSQVLARNAYGTILRFLAFSRLAAVLAVAVSFAIFLATMMQVQKLETQNRYLLETNQLQEGPRVSGLISGELNSLLSQIESEYTNAVRLDDNSEAVGLDLKLLVDTRLKGPTWRRLINLTHRATPYHFVDYEREPPLLTARPYSPERGLLLKIAVRYGAPMFFWNSPSPGYNDNPSFYRAFLRGYKFDKDVILPGFDLRFSSFSAVHARGIKFQHCDLEGADFESSITSNAKFTFSNLNRASFKRAVLYGANFYEAAMSEVDLTEAVLINADFSDTLLLSPNLEGAVMATADRADDGIPSLQSYMPHIRPENERRRWTLVREKLSFAYPPSADDFVSIVLDSEYYWVIREN